ncbi:MAG TPA: MFS transporter [Thermomicrobiales bacterium]|nr:MFS transporter [Thermomicrobiales bacterium]
MNDPSITLLQRHRSFRAYWLGQSASVFGSEVSAFALPLVSALTLDAGPVGVSVVATAAMLPYLLFSLLAGHWLATRDEQRVMVRANLLQAVLMAAIPLAWVGGWLSVPLLATVAFVSGTAEVVFALAAFAYVPRLVTTDDIPDANRTVQSTQTVAQIGGPGLAGLLVQVVGAPLALLVDALSYLASALGVSRGRSGQSEASAPAREKADWGVMSGLQALWGNPHLRILTMHSAAFNFATPIITINLVLWAVQEQGMATGVYGLAIAAGGAGGLLGALFANHLALRLGFGHAYGVAVLLYSLLPALLVAWPLTGNRLALVIAPVLLCSGIGLGSANVYALSLRQLALPADLLTRSAGAYRQITFGVVPVGTLLAGGLGAVLGTRPAVFTGVLLLVVGMVPMFGARMRSLPSPQAARVVTSRKGVMAGLAGNQGPRNAKGPSLARRVNDGPMGEESVQGCRTTGRFSA